MFSKDNSTKHSYNHLKFHRIKCQLLCQFSVQFEKTQEAGKFLRHSCHCVICWFKDIVKPCLNIYIRSTITIIFFERWLVDWWGGFLTCIGITLLNWNPAAKLFQNIVHEEAEDIFYRWYEGIRKDGNTKDSKSIHPQIGN